MSKKKKGASVKFLGQNASSVTGSINLVKFMDYNVLLDCGGYQSSDDEADYKINSKFHKDLKPAKLDAVVISHAHIDHTLLIPMLFAKGANCPVYIPNGLKGLLTYMLQDSVKIFQKKKERFGWAPLYSQGDVDSALAHMVECDLHEQIKINKHIAFTYFNAKHIPRSRQIYLELNDGVNVKRIGYTGDISDKVESYYVADFEPLPAVDLLIGECTYGKPGRTSKSRDRKKDLEKLHTAIERTMSNKGKVLIPTFTVNRLQETLTLLYQLIQENPRIKVLVDSPLGINVSSIWADVIDKNSELWNDIYRCANFFWVREFADTLNWAKINEPMVIVTGGGMLQASRGVFWAKELLGSKNNTIVFTGFSTPGSVASQIKSGELKKLKIDGQTVPINASVTTLNSLSGHMGYDELLNYYKTIPYNKIALVHGEFDSKVEFTNTLRAELSKLNRTSKVICVNYESEVDV